MLIHGHYKLFRRRSAVRNAWCTVCGQPRLAVGFRSLVVVHVFWVPMFPIARVTDWLCATCGQDPRANSTFRPSTLRWAFVAGGLLILGGLVVLATGLSQVGRHDRSDAMLESAAILLGGFAVLGLAFLHGRRTAELGFDDGKTPVAPLTGDTCPLCGELMLTRDNPRCARCEVDIQTS